MLEGRGDLISVLHRLEFKLVRGHAREDFFLRTCVSLLVELQPLELSVASGDLTFLSYYVVVRARRLHDCMSLPEAAGVNRDLSRFEALRHVLVRFLCLLLV